MPMRARNGSSMPRLKQLPFAAVVALKTLAYAAIICFFVILAPRIASRPSISRTVSASVGT